MKRLTVCLLGVLALAGAACGSSKTAAPSSAPPSTSVAQTPPATSPPSSPSGSTGPTIQAGAGGALIFSPSALSVVGGTTITVINVGSIPHTFTIANLHIDETIAPGETDHIKVPAQTGSFQFICRFHQSSGMTGTLTITG